MSRVHPHGGPARPAFSARHYRWLALGFLALAVYGSLVPFHFRPLPWGEALARFQEVCSRPVRVESRSDWAANILLFIPLGFLLMAALCVDRPRVAPLAALAVVPLCAALSAAIEFAQLYFPPRVSSLNDVVAESVGGLVGVLGWLLAGRQVTDGLRRSWTGLGRQGPAAPLLAVYLALLALVEALPLDLTISPVEIYHKYRDGLIHLMPFGPRPGSRLELLQSYLWAVALLLPVGLLLGRLSSRFWESRRNWPWVLGGGMVVSVLAECEHLFVNGRHFDTTRILIGGFTVLAGWALALHSVRCRLPSGSLTARKGFPGLRLILLAAWLGVAIFLNWQPFNFLPDLSAALTRLREVSLLPFADYYQGDYLNTLDQVLRKVILFSSLGVLLEPAFRPSKRAIPLLIGLAVATVLEAGQLFLPTRYASFSDILVEGFGTGLGLAVARRVWAASPGASCPLPAASAPGYFSLAGTAPTHP